MIVSPESWSQRADPARAAAAALFAIGVFAAAWGFLHVGFYRAERIPDTPIYQRYGEAMALGEVPYRDFRLEYPPGALPAFVVPSLVVGEGDLPAYERAFELAMLVCGAATLALMAATLASLRAGGTRRDAALAFAALSPLALGSLVLSRFDLWPAALTAAALAALVAGRDRLGFAALAAAVATKLYPGVLVPLAVAHVWRRGGRREVVRCLGVFVGVLALIVLPFAIMSPDGVAWALARQASRPLQIESLGSGLLLAAHQIFGFDLVMRSGHGSQNLTGAAATVLGVVLTVVQGVVLVGVWLWYSRGQATPERLVRAAASAVCAFVVLGRVFSPQFLIWLVPLVPLVAGRRGLRAAALLAVAIVLTQLWFPYRYWDLALELDAVASWLVLARDLVMVGVLVTLLWPERPRAQECSA